VEGRRPVALDAPSKAFHHREHRDTEKIFGPLFCLLRILCASVPLW
jgi:hypothetical protein